MVDADPSRPISLDDVARSIAASRRSLQRAFEHEGITFRQALSVARVRRAKALLAQGELPVSLVAERVGYQSKAEFAKAFRRHTGMRPSEYRRAMRHERSAAGGLAPAAAA